MEMSTGNMASALQYRKKKMSKNLVIVGLGMFAEVALSYFKEYTQYKICAFSCHSKYKTQDSFCGIPVFPLEEILESHPKETYEVFVAIGYSKMNQIREQLYKEIKELGYTFANFIHPNVKIWDSTKIGENVFIFEDNTIQPFTKIGSNTILWSGNHIGHHSNIGENCFISSHVVISGSCNIGNNVFIGVNATLRDDIQIGNHVLIGAASIVMSNAKDKEVFVANSTKKFKKNSDQIKL